MYSSQVVAAADRALAITVECLDLVDGSFMLTFAQRFVGVFTYGGTALHMCWLYN